MAILSAPGVLHFINTTTSRARPLANATARDQDHEPRPDCRLAVRPLARHTEGCHALVTNIIWTGGREGRSWYTWSVSPIDFPGCRRLRRPTSFPAASSILSLVYQPARTRHTDQDLGSSVWTSGGLQPWALRPCSVAMK